MSLDTTRADHLACYGYPRQTTPTLDLLAEEGIRYTNAVSTSSWTLPSHASMFTGKFVTTHGARKHKSSNLTLDDAFDGTTYYSGYSVETVRPGELLLAELLKGAGFATGAVVAGPWLKRVFGLNRGFDYYDDHNILGLGEHQKRIGPEVTKSALEWLKGVDSRPFFLFLNYFDPHTPYSLPAGFARPFESSPNPGLHEKDTATYDHEILLMDYSIHQLFNGMQALGLLDNTIIVAIGDHGELFGESGRSGHGKTLYTGEIHVPLIVRYPIGEQMPAVREEYIQPIDLVPLILGRLDLPVPDHVQGSPPELISHPILAEVYPREEESPPGQWQCLIEDGKKLLFNSKGKHELYDIVADRYEANNLVQTNPALLHDMIAKLLTHFDALPRPEGAPPPLTIDASTMEELEAMGYL